MKKQIGIFGGSFNPPHIGHLLLAEWLGEAANLDEVWWMPAATPPHKVLAGRVSGEIRLGMVEAVIMGNARFRSCDFEVRKGNISYTVETLRAFEERYPEMQFSLIIGGDSLQQFHTWRLYPEILQRARLLVYNRVGTDFSEVHPEIMAHATLFPAPLIELSSTAIRERIRQGLSIRYQVPEAVREIISSECLYQV
ncbi:MAG TPA: nicotinate (nicotinamide) nucleotide adenylyltransferase [Rhodothermales bacterium]|nr:nicotinate (nicotinamide) nucleotide adenylyltransferase [Bacteroidota bacterium]HRK72655.1 nicotinate (nicotinamide) nucleotide adenylyltransferase [Rhodothermales bacterium]HRR07800.1 nicotinate (nicotinamide) nucleotide adenylyltransferase [Rhodothermales bacterium]